jgi:hypothetical protein
MSKTNVVLKHFEHPWCNEFLVFAQETKCIRIVFNQVAPNKGEFGLE